MNVDELYAGNTIEVEDIGYVELLQFIRQGLPYIEGGTAKSYTRRIDLTSNITITENWENKNPNKRSAQMNYQRWRVKVVQSDVLPIDHVFDKDLSYIESFPIDKEIRSEEPSLTSSDRTGRIIDRFIKVNGKEIF